jgi:hypothetical protein
MAKHDVQITISKTGEVTVHVEGAKGKACMEYAKWLTQVIGRVKEQRQTSEYYEPETKSRIDLHQSLKAEDESA